MLLGREKNLLGGVLRLIGLGDLFIYLFIYFCSNVLYLIKFTEHHCALLSGCPINTITFAIELIFMLEIFCPYCFNYIRSYIRISLS